MVREGSVRRDTLVRQNPDGEWTRAANVEGLFRDSSLALSAHPVRHASIPVTDGRDRISGKLVRLWLWVGVALAGILLVVVWVAVARRIREEQRTVAVAKEFVSRADPASASRGDARAKAAGDSHRQEIRRFVGHTDIVKAVAFSPDGRFLLSGGGSINFQKDRSVEETAAPAASKPEGQAESSDDASVLSTSEREEHAGDYSVRVWDAASARQVHVLKGHLEMVGAAAFSPDGRYALSADIGGTVILWDAHDWREVHRFRGVQRERHGLGETRAINAVAFSPDGQFAVLAGWGYEEGVASASYDKNPHLILWDLETGEEATRAGPEGSAQSYFDRPVFVDELHSAGYTPDGAWIVVGASGSNAGMYYYRRSGAVFRAVGTTSPKPRVLNRDLHDPDRFVYDLEDRNFGSSGHDAPSASFVSTAIAPDGGRAVSADTLGRLCLWAFHPDPKNPPAGVDRIAQIDLSDRPVRCTAFSPKGTYFVTGGDDLLLWHAMRDTLEVAWELGPRPTGTFRAKAFHIHSVAFSHDGQYLAAGCDDRIIRLWKVP